MRLKGQNSKRLKKEQKEKMEKTLEKMQETREKDSAYLRDILKNKLAWALAEKQKGMVLIEKTRSQVLRLDGIIIFIQDTLKDKKEENDNIKN